MGYHIRYFVRLVILATHTSSALTAINDLHSVTSLRKNARGGCYPKKGNMDDLVTVRRLFWYAFASNPDGDSDFTCLSDAIEAWRLFTDVAFMGFTKNGAFVADGSYHGQLGQQQELLEAVAPYCKDVCFAVVGEDYDIERWAIQNHVFTATPLFSPTYPDRGDEKV